MKSGLADRIAKRALDVAVAGVGLLVTAPVQLVLAAVIARRLGRPVLFVQARPGKGAKVFHLVKFRTMLPVDESRGLVTDEDRMTAFGATLRSTSLDELPTLWNVLRGDMSLVGPRPLLVRYLERYSPRQARRHDVRPGVTGLAQINGRNAISWADKLELDVRYVETRSFFGDLGILLSTVRKVFRREGITDSTSVTVAEFIGNGDVQHER
ncbi:sugar transferase [Frigoribacterium sp. PhB118]|uniref:sugar transferase n=1 Tax=Frigoribacterium sp. PhB118 TaxID=2485175 RepID=UPI000F48A6A6|nr:sugar transferase [Frigoribacterium sp. PhB118]ROS57056.1 lipopolysaccharide/colanic/teichoic acid biosynthesis glycosyltransferase [Frigoribacterium sp. PhB118]